jgi:hypothetical protein
MGISTQVLTVVGVGRDAQRYKSILQKHSVDDNSGWSVTNELGAFVVQRNV